MPTNPSKLTSVVLLVLRTDTAFGRRLPDPSCFMQRARITLPPPAFLIPFVPVKRLKKQASEHVKSRTSPPLSAPHHLSSYCFPPWPASASHSAVSCHSSCHATRSDHKDQQKKLSMALQMEQEDEQFVSWYVPPRLILFHWAVEIHHAGKRRWRRGNLLTTSCTYLPLGSKSE